MKTQLREQLSRIQSKKTFHFLTYALRHLAHKARY